MNEALYPAQVGLLGADGVVLEADIVSLLVKQLESVVRVGLVSWSSGRMGN